MRHLLLSILIPIATSAACSGGAHSPRAVPRLRVPVVTEERSPGMAGEVRAEMGAGLELSGARRSIRLADVFLYHAHHGEPSVASFSEFRIAAAEARCLDVPQLVGLQLSQELDSVASAESRNSSTLSVRSVSRRVLEVEPAGGQSFLVVLSPVELSYGHYEVSGWLHCDGKQLALGFRITVFREDP